MNKSVMDAEGLPSVETKKIWCAPKVVFLDSEKTANNQAGAKADEATKGS